MRTLTACVLALVVAGGALAAGSRSERFVPFTTVARGEASIDMNRGHAAHKSLYVASTRAGVLRIAAHLDREDEERLLSVDLRSSMVVAAFADYPFPELCRRNLTIRRVRLHRGRLDATATVEDFSGCMGYPEIVATHLYSVAAFPRRVVPKRPQVGQLLIRVTPTS